jgi:hypothetical protein
MQADNRKCINHNRPEARPVKSDGGAKDGVSRGHIAI